MGEGLEEEGGFADAGLTAEEDGGAGDDAAAEDAMLRAEAMVAAYVAAGFRKIHLDCSMGCAGEAAALDDETTATRAARLAGIAEQQAA